MHASKINYVVVGAFVVAMIVGLVVVLTRLTGWTASTDKYFTVFHNVTGVTDGTKVFYEGFAVGRVTDVQRLPSKLARELLGERAGRNRVWFRVGFEVKQGWSIPPGSVAEIVAPGLLSAVTVNIAEQPGEEKVVRREIEGVPMIPGREAETIAKVMRRAGPLADQLQALLKRADDTLRSGVDPLLGEAREFVTYVRREMPKLLAKADRFATTINEVADELKLLVGEDNRRQVEQMIGKLNRAASDVKRLTGRANKLLASLNDLVGDNRENIDESLKSLRYVMDALARDIDSISQNLEGTSRNMYEFSREIRRNPALLLGGTTPRGSVGGGE